MAITNYTPEIETYISDEEGLIHKIEKVIIKEDDELSLAYVGVDNLGTRRIIDDKSSLAFFMDIENGSMRESDIKCLLSQFPEPDFEMYYDQLKDYGIKTILKKDGSNVSLEEYMKQD